MVPDSSWQARRFDWVEVDSNNGVEETLENLVGRSQSYREQRAAARYNDPKIDLFFPRLRGKCGMTPLRVPV
jgi:hypothetical protein